MTEDQLQRQIKINLEQIYRFGKQINRLRVREQQKNKIDKLLRKQQKVIDKNNLLVLELEALSE